jgi:hypothetical protein
MMDAFSMLDRTLPGDTPEHRRHGLEAIVITFQQGLGKWKGCDWSTHVGATGIDPEGLTSAQALLAARATGGQESGEWMTLSVWLAQVEEDACNAEEHARQAMELARTGNLLQALMQAQQACALEAHYPRHSVWLPLLGATTAALAEWEPRNVGPVGPQDNG